MANYTRKYSDAQRRAIAADIEATAGTPEGSYRQIASRHGCAVATVQRIAEENNLGDRWKDGQHQTAAATSVNQTNGAQRRAALQLDLLDDAQALRARLFGDVTHLNVVKGYPPGNVDDDEPRGIGPLPEYVEHTVLPAGPREWRDTMSAIGIASSKSVELARLEAEQAGTGTAGALLDQFLGALVKDRQERTPPPSEDG
ncbi:hypothetical protein [Actinophytocola sediminis]